MLPGMLSSLKHMHCLFLDFSIPGLFNSRNSLSVHGQLQVTETLEKEIIEKEGDDCTLDHLWPHLTAHHDKCVSLLLYWAWCFIVISLEFLLESKAIWFFSVIECKLSVFPLVLITAHRCSLSKGAFSLLLGRVPRTIPGLRVWKWQAQETC